MATKPSPSPSLSLAEPDARLFVLPASCKVTDLRDKATKETTSVSIAIAEWRR